MLVSMENCQCGVASFQKSFMFIGTLGKTGNITLAFGREHTTMIQYSESNLNASAVILMVFNHHLLFLNYHN